MRNKPPWLWAAAIGGAAILVLIIVNVIAVTQKPSDKEQILAAIEEMRQASIDGREGGFLEHLSQSFELPGDWPGRAARTARNTVAKAIADAKVRSLEVNNIRVDIAQDTAVATCDVSTTFSYLTFPEVSLNFKDVQIEFRREIRKRLFVVPDPTWLVVSFSNVTPEDLPY